MIVIDAPLRIAETPMVSLTCVDGRQGKGLRGVKWPQKFRVEAIFKGVRRFVVCNPYPVRGLQRGVSDFSEVELVETLRVLVRLLSSKMRSPTSLKSN